jgi:hypothetical protein
VSNPCYSADVAQALHNVTLVFWALFAVLVVAAVAACVTNRWRPE